MLAKRLPAPAEPVANRSQTYLATDRQQLPDFDERDVVCFVHSYSDLAFGWSAAYRLAAAEMDFPFFPEGRTRWVWLAYRLLQDSRGNADKEIFAPLMHAVSLHFTHEGKPTREALNAFLIAPDASIEIVAARTGLPEAVVDAYDALFFNATDRRDDRMYLRNIAYPNTRMEEMLPGYMAKANLGQVLLRQGYNTSVEAVASMAGFRDMAPTLLSSAAATEAFTVAVMRQAAQLVELGMLNHDRTHQAIAIGKSLTVAGKLGGEDTSGDASNGHISRAMNEQLELDGESIRRGLESKFG